MSPKRYLFGQTSLRAAGRAERERMSSGSRAALTLVEVLVVIAIIGLLVGLLIPSVQSARESARVASCAANLKQIGVACQRHTEAHGHLPFQRGISNYGGPQPCSPRGKKRFATTAERQAAEAEWAGTAPPSGRAGSTANANPCTSWASPMGNETQVGGFAYLLPYLDQQTVWDRMNTSSGWGSGASGVPVLPMGLPPGWTDYAPWNTKIPAYMCPTAPFGIPGVNQDYHTPSPRRMNYAMCIGDLITHNDGGWGEWYPPRPRGVFGWESRTTAAHIIDGLSQTIMMAERANAVQTPATPNADVRGMAVQLIGMNLNLNPGRCLATAINGRYIEAVADKQFGPNGIYWEAGNTWLATFNTILPPNSPSCARDYANRWGGIVSASSYHPGGAMNVLMADGAVRRIDETIDCGRLDAAEPAPGRPSPYGVWGALGTIAGQEGQGDNW